MRQKTVITKLFQSVTKVYYKVRHVLESVSKIVSHHGWPTAKIKKKHWIKRPKAVPKIRNLDQNINDSKSSILNFLF